MEREAVCRFEGDGLCVRQGRAGDDIECGRSFKVIADFGDEHALDEQHVGECDCEDKSEDNEECHRGGLHGCLRQSESFRERKPLWGRDSEGS